MNQLTKTKRWISVLIMLLLISFAELALGISAAYYFSKYNDNVLNFKEKICTINDMIIDGLFMDTLTGFLSSLLVISWIIRSKFFSWIQPETMIFLFVIIHSFKFMFLLINLWTYQDNLECRDFVMANAPELWIFIMNYYISAWVIIGLTGLFLILRISQLLYKKIYNIVSS